MKKLASDAPPPCPEDADAWRAYQSFLKRLDALPESRRVEQVGNALCDMLLEVLVWMPSEDLPGMVLAVIQTLQEGTQHDAGIAINFAPYVAPPSRGMH